MLQFGQIGENRFWELRYFIPAKIPGNKLTEKKSIKQRKAFIKTTKYEKKSSLCIFVWLS